MKHKAFTSQVSELGPRQVSVICSTSTIDRAGEQIVQEGIDLSSFATNPVVLWAHDPTQPIGKAFNVRLGAQGLLADVEFAPPGISARADEICGMVKSGFLNTVSIGFDPLDCEPMNPSKPKGPQRYLAIDLMELSFVAIPANPQAAVVNRARHVKADAAKWEVCGATDLPIELEGDWDGRDAATRILDDAGFDSNEPDHAKAMRGFLVYDSANPDLRTAYKLPFADIQSGKLVAVAAGIRAAASRISQTDIPDDVQAGAQKIIDQYEEKMKEQEQKAAPASVTRAAAKAPVARAGAAPRRKDLYDIGQLAYLLASLGWLQHSARVEAALEGDGSDLPAQLASVMQDMGAALVAMTAEEVAEAITEAKGTLGQEDDMAGLDDAETTIVLTSATPALRRFRAGYYTTKALGRRVKEGRTLSAASQDSLKTALEHHDTAMDAHREALKAHTKCAAVIKSMLDGAAADNSNTDTQSTSDGGVSDAGESTAKSRTARMKEAAGLRAA